MAELGACAGKTLGHFAQDVQTAIFCLMQGNLHDLLGDTGDLDVHLQRGDAIFRACHLEIHVAEVILVAKNVGKHRIALAFKDEAHRDTGDWALQWHASIHQSER